MSYQAKKSSNKPVDLTCPTPEQVIADYLQESNCRIPKGAPADPFQFARFWMAHQPAKDGFTEAALPPVSKGGGWTTPYHDRLIQRLKVFVRLKALHQVYIIEHIERGVAWHGDPVEHYIDIVKEYDRMREKIESGQRDDYIDDCFRQMKKAARNMTV